MDTHILRDALFIIKQYIYLVISTGLTIREVLFEKYDHFVKIVFLYVTIRNSSYVHFETLKRYVQKHAFNLKFKFMLYKTWKGKR